jgi:hypothetical protein
MRLSDIVALSLKLHAEDLGSAIRSAPTPFIQAAREADLSRLRNRAEVLAEKFYQQPDTGFDRERFIALCGFDPAVPANPGHGTGLD